MFASPLKQSASSRRAVNVQQIGKEEYANMVAQPVLIAGSRSVPADRPILPMPIQKEDLSIRIAKEIPKPPAEEPRKPLEPISP
jgi:hypothetical protein